MNDTDLHHNKILEDYNQLREFLRVLATPYSDPLDAIAKCDDTSTRKHKIGELRTSVRQVLHHMHFPIVVETVEHTEAELKRVKTLEQDALLGKVAMRFVDRAGDVHPGIDDAEDICADFYKAMCKALDLGRTV